MVLFSHTILKILFQKVNHLFGIMKPNVITYYLMPYLLLASKRWDCIDKTTTMAWLSINYMASMPNLVVIAFIFKKMCLHLYCSGQIPDLKMSTSFSLISGSQQTILSVISKVIKLSRLVSSKSWYMYFGPIFRVLQYGIMKALLFSAVVGRLNLLFFLLIQCFVNNQVSSCKY